MKAKIIFLGVSILLLVVLFMVPFSPVVDEEGVSGPMDSSALAENDEVIDPVLNDIEASTRAVDPKIEEESLETNAPRNQRQKLLDASIVVEEKTMPLPQGSKRSLLLKSPFKYSYLQRDVIMNEAQEVISDGIYVADHVLIKFPPALEFEQIEKWSREAGFVIRKKLKTDAIYLVSTPVVSLYGAEKLIQQFESDFGEGGLEIMAAVAEKDYIYTTQATPNDPDYSSLWGLHNTGQTGGLADADIDAPEAWDITTGNRDVVVAVIDTGIDLTHPDLVDNIWVNPGEIPANGIDDDGNGFIDDVNGWDFANDDSSPQDDNDHGTHVAGTIGALGNDGVGVVGVNWEVAMMAIKFLGASGSGSTSDAIDAVNYTTQMGVQLTSNSWGGGGFSSLLEAAIEDAADNDILFVAAAGNASSNTDTSFNYPSGYDIDTIISVASTTDTDALSSFSNYGATTVDLGAPGSSILSTTVGGYGTFNGTSMATPHVSGVLCLMKSLAPGMPALDLKSMLLDSTDPVNSLSGMTVSGGRLNALNAIVALEGSYLTPNSVEIEILSGNGDSYLNPGESGNFVFTVVNRGVDPSINGLVTLNMTPANPDLSIGPNSVSIGDLEPQELSGEFRIAFTVSNTASTPQHLSYELITTDDGGNSLSTDYSFSVYNTFTVSGNIFDLDNAAPIEGARVVAEGPVTSEAITDASGNYTLSVVDGEYDIRVSADGFLDSIVTQQTVPPSISNLDIGLGIPSLEVAPSIIDEELEVGQFMEIQLTLSNSGSTSVAWTLATARSSTPTDTVVLDEIEYNLYSDENDVSSTRVASSITTNSLLGSHFGIMGSSSSVLVSDLTDAGAEITNLSFPLSASDLEELNALILDDVISSANSSDIVIIREWAEQGGGLLLTGDTTVENNNAILADTGITAVRFADGSYPTETITDITSDPLTEGVDSVILSAYGTTSTVVDAARSLMRNSAGNTVLAVSNLGKGPVIYLSNEINSSIGEDGRVLANNIADYLAKASFWLKSSSYSGEITAGSNEIVSLTLDATDLAGGVHHGEVIFESNELEDSIHIVPVTLLVTGILEVTPSIIDEELVVGNLKRFSFTLSNSGSVPISWTLATAGGSTPTDTVVLDEIEYNLYSDENDVSSTWVASSITTNSLLGSHFGIMGSSSSLLVSDLTDAGAEITNLSFPLSASDLEELNALILDDVISSANSSDIVIIREWAEQGGGLLLTGDTTVENNNAILADTGITAVRFADSSYPTEIITDITSDPITEGVDSVTLSAYGTTSTVVDTARSLMRNSAGNTVLAVSNLGKGPVIYLSNEINSNIGEDGRVLANNIADYLAKASFWLKSSSYSGEITAGSNEIVSLTLDATDLVWGIYYGEVIFNSNGLQNSTHTVPVKLTVYEFPYDSYNTWRNLFFGGDVPGSGFIEDWNNDGLTNGQEFFFSINPNEPSLGRDHLPSIAKTFEGCSLTYTRNSELTDAMLTWYKSDNLKNWELLEAIEPEFTDHLDGTTTVELMLGDMTEDRQFYKAELLSDQ